MSPPRLRYDRLQPTRDSQLVLILRRCSRGGRGSMAAWFMMLSSLHCRILIDLRREKSTQRIALGGCWFHIVARGGDVGLGGERREARGESDVECS